MAKLNDRQQRLLDAVGETLRAVEPSLKRLRDDYDIADYRGKAPVRAAIEAATSAGVPFNRITKDGMGFTYPGKLRDWLEVPDALVNRMNGDDPVAVATEKFQDTVEKVTSVTRDNGTGDIVVTYLGDTYRVKSFGDIGGFWSGAEPTIPEAVYKLIGEEYPQWELVEDGE